MYTLKSETQKNIETCVAIPFSKIVSMDSIDDFKKNKPSFSSKRDFRKIGRGNPFLARKRFRTMEEVDKKLAAINYEDSQ